MKQRMEHRLAAWVANRALSFAADGFRPYAMTFGACREEVMRLGELREP
jgi:hypothetical protein